MVEEKTMVGAAGAVDPAGSLAPLANTSGYSYASAKSDAQAALSQSCAELPEGRGIHAAGLSRQHMAHDHAKHSSTHSSTRIRSDAN